MTLRLIQLETAAKRRLVAALDDEGGLRRVDGVTSVLELANIAIRERKSLEVVVRARRTPDAIELSASAEAVHILPPIDHPDPAHLHLTGTGLTHLGSAEGRDKMHAMASAGGAQTDSMRMFLEGLKGGKPPAGTVGSQPEWFYKGNGYSVVASGSPLASPAFALDGGEEPGIAGIYVIDPEGNPRRLGFCLANEFSDHITERGNYLWLAHSKLRQAALGAEILTGPLPEDVRGVSRIIRGDTVLWEKPFLTGEANMSHTLANLEHHHFKYSLFRKPGDVHVHFFGTATLSFSDGVQTKEGDIFEIEATPFRLPLRNRLTRIVDPWTAVRQL